MPLMLLFSVCDYTLIARSSRGRSEIEFGIRFAEKG
jgi:hypothetical protein